VTVTTNATTGSETVRATIGAPVWRADRGGAATGVSFANNVQTVFNRIASVATRERARRKG